MNGQISASSCDAPWSFHLRLYTETEQIGELWLPGKVDGFHRFSSSSVSHLFAVEARSGNWVIRCTSPAFFEDVSIASCQEYLLTETSFLTISLEEHRLYLAADRLTSQFSLYTRHVFKRDIEISIGRRPDCDICVLDSCLAPRHAAISYDGRNWSIAPYAPENLIFINGKRAARQALRLGDHVALPELHILIGTNFVSLSSPGGEAVISSRISKSLSEHSGKYQAYSGYSIPAPDSGSPEENTSFFNRAPRKASLEPQESVTIEGPPMSMQEANMPLILRMGNSMVMGGRAAFTGNYTGILTSLLFPLLTSRYTEEQRREYEARRFERYTHYLGQIQEEIEKKCSAEASRQNLLFPDIATLLQQSREHFRLWERRPSDDDFLVLRLGSGNRESSLQLSYPEHRFDLEEDPLLDQMYRVADRSYMLHHVPICCSLCDDPVTGIIGPRAPVLELIRQIIVQIAARHSYDEVKMILLASPAEMELLRYTRFLPHFWNDAFDVRLLAADEADACTLGQYLQDIFPEPADLTSGRLGEEFPHFVVIALDHRLFSSVEFFKTVLRSELLTKFSFLTGFDELPKECTKIIDLQNSSKPVLISLRADSGPDLSFQPDTYEPEHMDYVVRMLANLKISAAARKQSLPKMLTFMELFQAGKLDHLNPLKRWAESDPIHSLSAPVGVHSDGSPFCLDLHEKHQGPHGLIAGMTGSGKSEFIITYILSMAVNYHPDEVAFILIDYKGGGLADAFSNPKTGVRLPHLWGTITNLDGAAIERSLMSIQSELIRRQNIFHDVKSSSSEGTIDIYSYQKLYRAGKVKEPMPHLFIISDEFAELKQQKPEFMEKLVSASRIGRSLGIHLVLATQKPSGVVNEQIRSNTKFRVCLRVQDRTDSMDMLRRPEAAELKDTGRFYLQVGYNEYFALGQSAWCGAEYTQQEEPPVSLDDSIEFLDNVGRLVTKATPTPTVRKSGIKQIVAVVRYLSDIADKIGYQSKSLWRDPLPASLDLDALPTFDDPLKAAIGFLDDPAGQDQFPLVLDLHKSRHMLIIGEARSGKTTAVKSLIYSLVQKNSPKNLNLYILDYSSRTLGEFSRLPHCGSVLQEEDAGNLGHFFRILNQIKDSRKRLFSELGVDTFEDAAAQQVLPLVLVVIDNLAGLGESKTGSELLFNLPKLMKGAANYGILFLLTCSHLNEISSRILQEISWKVCLNMRDKYDYSAVLGPRTNYLPPALPGRGLFAWDGRLLEVQMAMLGPELTLPQRHARLRAALSQISAACTDTPHIRQMPVLALDATYEAFSGQFDAGRLPLGFALDTKQPVALPFKQFSALSVYQGNPQGVKPILENFLFAARREQMELWLVKAADSSCFNPGEENSIDLSGFPHLHCFDSEPSEMAALWNQFSAVCTSRRKLLEDRGILDCSDLDSVFPCLHSCTAPILLLIENFADFCRQLNYVYNQTFLKGFQIALLRNIHVIAMYDSLSPEPSAINELYGSFNSDGNVLIFSDSDRRKVLPQVPVSVPPEGKQRPFNAFTMLYRSACHPMVMPCGGLVREETDPDDLSIF